MSVTPRCTTRSAGAEAERITHHPKPLLVNRSYLMLPRQLVQSDVLRERFNARLQQFRDDGRYQQYFDDLQAGHYQPVPEMPRHNRKNGVPGFPPARE